MDPDSLGAILGADSDDSEIAGLSGLTTNAAGRSASIAATSALSTDADIGISPPSGRAVATESPPPAFDPIDEAPSAVWYVRPATGGQFGPASGEIMRAWIGEGRVGASSLVWRAGWPEWRAASAIFPQLGTMLASPGVSTGPPHRLATSDAETIVNGSNGAPSTLPRRLPTGQVVLSVAPEIPSAASSPSPAIPALTAGLRKKKRNKDVSLIASAILLVISIILVVILVMIWSSQGSPGPAPEEASETASEVMAQ